MYAHIRIHTYRSVRMANLAARNAKERISKPEGPRDTSDTCILARRALKMAR